VDDCSIGVTATQVFAKGQITYLKVPGSWKAGRTSHHRRQYGDLLIRRHLHPQLHL